ncbi:MAG: T9SS C-terminal target domain-containing protein [Bacteroidetes bacterium]|nr:MAG: T9SS C-terminal target domain-containing protein [Bacteroidota bacterium]REK00932.1 MAG: T9SS C-terminal target domain-containing protein [Bacteroidota bacterium]REK34535.1 MAG: T9SS C-terminal target domain-containing protein [Bacteroidota bacterium]REK51793.1 MAG: T9SS C-terminal target domain-containing protein [Bacteroidota bacterium]
MKPVTNKTKDKTSAENRALSSILRFAFQILICSTLLLSAREINASGATSLQFSNPVLESGTAGALNAEYRFSNVTSGVDALAKINAISNGASVATVDIPSSTTGYNPAFQPEINIASGTSGSPKTSYVEWLIRFKKAGTGTDTTLSQISATAIDVDGTSNLQEMVEAHTPTSYSVNSSTSLSIVPGAGYVNALGPNTNYSGIDSSVKSVMFQLNFSNVNSLRYRTGGINKSSSAARQFSIYFITFFSTATTLPVELISFTARPENDGKVRLNWVTASEHNNAYFIVERSSDGRSFNPVATINGSGSSSQRQEYVCIDNFPYSGQNYYQLVQVDHDGNTRTYPPVNIKIDKLKGELVIHKVSSNPFRDKIFVNLSAPESMPMKFSIMNSSGTEVRSENAEIRQGNNSMLISNLDDLNPGIYYLQVSQNNSISNSVRIIKN